MNESFFKTSSGDINEKETVRRKDEALWSSVSKNPIPRQEIFEPVDHVKYEGQVRSQQHFLFVQFSR